VKLHDRRKEIIMKTVQAKVLAVLALGLVLCLVLRVRAMAAEPDSPIPAVLRAGFAFFQKQRPELGVDAWKEGGLVGEESTGASHAGYFRQAERTLGKYLAWEWVETKMIGKSSKIIYLSINYERGAVYARFLVYRTEKDWVVQSMNFNTQPEALMPWLAFGDGQ
jgi:hypothetical protein